MSSLQNQKRRIKSINNTLNITNASKVYSGAKDEKGNSALKLGTGSVVSSFKFTVADDVNKVVIYIAQYKANKTEVTINGVKYSITTSSNIGAYTAIEIDTTTTKTISLATVANAQRAMINTIEFYS